MMDKCQNIRYLQENTNLMWNKMVIIRFKHKYFCVFVE
jgi:hypothetical protein